MSFRDALDALSAYLLRKHPSKCLLSLETVFEAMFENIGREQPNKINTGLTGDVTLSDN